MQTQTASDHLIDFIDTSLRTLFGKPIVTNRSNPAELLANNHHFEPSVKLGVKQAAQLNLLEQQKSAGFMRVNHCGEVCAQALYQGQALTTRNPDLKTTFKQAALEENDHLAWCQTRLIQLNSHTSYLNPLWYLGSFSIGIIAGLAGDQYNLGFLAETEKQVSKHLGEHLIKLPIKDSVSRAIVAQMQLDEQKHAATAIEAGGVPLPTFVKYSMRLSAKLMTTIAYYI